MGVVFKKGILFGDCLGVLLGEDCLGGLVRCLLQLNLGLFGYFVCQVWYCEVVFDWLLEMRFLEGEQWSCILRVEIILLVGRWLQVRLMLGMVVQQQLRRWMVVKVVRLLLLLVMMFWNIFGLVVLDIVRFVVIMCVEYKCRYVRYWVVVWFWNRVRYCQWWDYLVFVIMIVNDIKKVW